MVDTGNCYRQVGLNAQETRCGKEETQEAQHIIYSTLLTTALTDTHSSLTIRLSAIIIIIIDHVNYYLSGLTMIL